MIEMPFSAPADYVPAVQPPPHPAPDALWFVFCEAKLLVGDGDARLPTAPESFGHAIKRRQYLGTLGTREIYTCEVNAETPAPVTFRWSDLRSLFTRMDDALFALAGRALQIIEWDRTHQYCGRCATPTAARDTERSRQCPACGLVVYPRIAPAVMALVRRMPDEILLARSPRFATGMYSALAGFVEPGETLEQCLAREVFEEVGVRVQNVRYFASQPWPFPHSLMIAFVADHAGGDINIDNIEIVAANWFKITDLPQLPQPISIARRLIDAVVGEMLASRVM